MASITYIIHKDIKDIKESKKIIHNCIHITYIYIVARPTLHVTYIKLKKEKLKGPKPLTATRWRPFVCGR